MSDSNTKYYGLLIIATFTWGASWVCAKILVDISPPLTIGFFRFLIASILFIVLLADRRVSFRALFSRANMKWLILLGLTGIFGYGVLFLVGMTFTTAAQGSIIAGFNPVTISIFALLIHKEKLKPKWKYVGFGISFIGVIFVVGVQAIIDFQPEHLLGNLIILGAMCIWGLYSSIAKSAMKTMTPLEATGGSAVIGMLFFGAGAIFEQPWTLPTFGELDFWINVGFLGIFTTVVGFLLFFICVDKLGATRTGGFINFVPVFGTALSVLILKETIYWTFMLGLLLIITGVSIMNYSRNRKEAKDTESIGEKNA
ncbi:MAG: DMT family transporter [Candidatus Thorarchaeota archaeon]|nr:DMT family transporter [Candidatus Thorarchaeota archaeon]